VLVLAPHNGLLQEQLSCDLADVEARFAAELLSDLPCVNSLVKHIERYRGKMLRPTLVLVSAMASLAERGLANVPTPAGGDEVAGGAQQWQPTREAHRVVATVVEMVHMATLVHDDILDDAQMRRRGQTVNDLSGNETAVMLGDYLISHAYHLCTSLGRPQISRMIADATNVVCEGELLQLANRGNWQLDEQTYFEIIGRKTASLCGTCCKLAAVLNQDGDQHQGEQEDTTAQALYDYGQKLGVAFQIVDDVLDLTGNEQTVGKTLGRDLEKSKLTLPLIHYLRSSDAVGRDSLLALLDTARVAAAPSPLSSDQIRELCDRLGQVDSVHYAQQWAAKLIDQAKAAIVDNLPASPAQTLLLDMADAVLTREF
jgi:octaprenyl-diphosphate synthase